MIRCAAILVFVTMCWGISAQQSPQFSQYLQNQYMINPAATGVDNFLNISMGGRMQWAGIENAPKTTYLYFSSPSDKLRSGSINRTFGKVRRNNKAVRHPVMRFNKTNHAWGGHFLADQYGPYRQIKMMGTYALHLPITRDYTISFGTSLGLSNRAFLPERAQVLSVLTNTGVFDDTYDQFASAQGSQNTMELEAGMYFYGQGAFFGVSMNQLTKDFVQFGNRAFNFDPRMHLFVTGGYKFSVNPKYSLTTGFVLKYVRPAPISIEFTGQLEIQQRYWAGLSYRHKDAVVAMVGMHLSDQFKIGYSFDMPTTDLRRYSAGSHELVLSLMFGKERTW